MPEMARAGQGLVSLNASCVPTFRPIVPQRISFDRIASIGSFVADLVVKILPIRKFVSLPGQSSRS